MGWFRGNGEGYTRGGMDVESAINLFFKGVLLFPVFLFAGYVGIAMMKHMIFHGVPVMNTVTEEQREILKEKDSQIGLPSKSQGESEVSVSEEVSQVPVYSEVSGAPGVVTDYEWELVELAYQRDVSEWRRWYRGHVNCLSVSGTECGDYVQQPSRDTSKYEL